MKKAAYFIVLLALLWGTLFPLSAQESAKESKSTRAEPIFPASSEGLLFMEGENAVSTNFSTTPLANYGCSSLRTLQLSSEQALMGDTVYNAEYVIYVEEEGRYEFWYGGTPPGPRENLYPSYASPFTLQIDEQEKESFYREDVTVVENYAPAYYWVRVGEFPLSPGIHKIRFEVPERRRYDGRFYFYLDAFFLLNPEKEPFGEEVLPEIFPRDRGNRNIDFPLRSAAAYEEEIKDNPNEVQAYIELGLVYSLIGDNLNAIRVLNRGAALDPENRTLLLLTAKNRIWRGDTREGIDGYRKVLTLYPEEPQLWAEAGKVAAWSGFYEEALTFYADGLKQFPQDLNLLVNYSLTYLWMSEMEKAAEIEEQAREQARKSPEDMLQMGRIQEASGYPLDAEETYQEAISEYPRHLTFYLALQELYLSSGRKAEAADVMSRIEQNFSPSLRLEQYLDTFRLKQGLRDTLIDEYRSRLRAEPDNLPLRHLLAQTYFWNGMKREAVNETRAMLINHAFHAMQTFDTGAAEWLRTINELYLRKEYLRRAEENLLQLGESIEAAHKKYEKALKEQEKKPEENSAARGLARAERELASAVAEGQALLRHLRSEQSAWREEQEALQARLEAAGADLQQFRGLADERGWRWDPGFLEQELIGTLPGEPALAGYLLGRLYQLRGATERAKGYYYLPGIAYINPPYSDYGYAESLLWEQRVEEAARFIELTGGSIAGYAPFTRELPAFWEELAGYSKLTPLFEPETASEAESSGEAITAEQEQIYEWRIKTGDLIEEIRRLLNLELQRRFYQWEQETAPLRYTLGSYLMDMGQNPEAARQFAKVLAIDPWNISALYKRGLVSQRYGNWSEAMESYRKVYYQDPGFGNAAGYHNQLARQNSDSFRSRVHLLHDSSRITTEATLAYTRKLNTFWDFELLYRQENNRIYRPYTGETAEAVALHSFESSLTLNLPDLDLALTPTAGLTTDSLLVAEDYFFPENDTVTPDEAAGFLSLFPWAGLQAAWQRDGVSLSGDYQWAPVKDTYFAAKRPLLRRHTAAMNLSLQHTPAGKEGLNRLSSRTYLKMDFIEDENLKIQALQEGGLELSVAKEPYSRLAVTGLVNFEWALRDSQRYYAPDGVLEAKSGLRFTGTYPADDYSRVWEWALWAGAGGYWSGLTERGVFTPAFKWEGGSSLFFVRGDITLYSLLNSSGTVLSDFSIGYWQFSLEIGASIGVPRLLAP